MNEAARQRARDLWTTPEFKYAQRQRKNVEALFAELKSHSHIGLHRLRLRRRSTAYLVGGFAALALVLSAVGLYGVIAYSVSRRTREIGVRMALGAQRWSVHRMVLREAAWLAAAGIAIGVVCSLAFGGLLRGLLFGVRTWDLPTLATVAIVLGLLALFASYIPAHRAASVNPVAALRAE